MATLFQLCSDLENLDRHLDRINDMWQTDDALLLMGETIALTDWIFADINHHKSSRQYYGLQDDWQRLTETTQIRIKQYPSIHLITDKQWVTLTDQYDKIITIS